MKLNTMILLVAVSLLLTGYMVSCFQTADIGGPSVEQLSDAADKQKSSTAVIDKEATNIQRRSKEDHSKQSAGKIKEANVDLKNNIDILAKEAESKEDAEKQLEKANERIKELEAEDNAWITWMCRIAVTIGVLMTAVGIVIFIKSGFTQWEVGALGISLTMSSGLAMWFFANIIWFILGIFALSAIGVILWVFLRTDKGVEAGVEVGEMLKKRIKNLKAVDETTDGEKYVKYDDVTAILIDIFGDDTHHGIAGTRQSDGVKAHITAKRKKINNKLKSLY